jgi:hypothetical protein
MFGYGPVAVSNLGGLVFGYILASDQAPTAMSFMQLVGIVLLMMGFTFTITRRNPIVGPIGGLLTGIGLGITIFSFIHTGNAGIT